MSSSLYATILLMLKQLTFLYESGIFILLYTLANNQKQNWRSTKLSKGECKDSMTGGPYIPSKVDDARPSPQETIGSSNKKQ